MVGLLISTYLVLCLPYCLLYLTRKVWLFLFLDTTYFAESELPFQSSRVPTVKYSRGHFVKRDNGYCKVCVGGVEVKTDYSFKLARRRQRLHAVGIVSIR